MNKVTIIRYPADPDRLRIYIVFIDGKQAGKISEYESLSFNINFGKHEFYLKIAWCRGRKLKFNSGDTR